MKIQNKKISINHPPFIIAKISANHNNSIKRTLRLVKEAKKAGADAIKLQTYKAESLTLNSHKSEFVINDKKSLWYKKSLFDLYKKGALPTSYYNEIFKEAKKNDIICFSTPFDEENVDQLERLKCPIYKIASFENNHFSLLKKIAKTKKPIIMSTGIATLKEIEKSVKFLKKNRSGKIHLLYCVSNYPSKIEDFNLKNISILKKKFKKIVGFSDHSVDDFVSFIAINEGAEIIEKHIALDKNSIDAEFSKKTNELKSYISTLKRIRFLKKKIIMFSQN